jgi:hypothetical protein
MGLPIPPLFFNVSHRHIPAIMDYGLIDENKYIAGHEEILVAIYRN